RVLFTLSGLLAKGAASSVLSPLSLHDALPISSARAWWKTTVMARPGLSTRAASWKAAVIRAWYRSRSRPPTGSTTASWEGSVRRSEEHTSELQSRENLVCRLLLEKKKSQHTHR